MTSVALKMSADGVPRQPDGPWSTLEQDLGEGKSNLDFEYIAEQSEVG